MRKQLSDTKRCTGPCQQMLARAEFDADESKADGLRSWCKQCRKKKAEVKEQQEIIEIVQNIEAPVLATLSEVQTGGTNLPHRVEALERIISLLGGLNGFAAFYVSQIIAAPPGGVVRERMLNRVLSAIELSSDDAKVSKPRHLMSDEELDARFQAQLAALPLEARMKLLPMPNMEGVDARHTA